MRERITVANITHFAFLHQSLLDACVIFAGDIVQLQKGANLHPNHQTDQEGDVHHPNLLGEDEDLHLRPHIGPEEEDLSLGPLQDIDGAKPHPQPQTGLEGEEDQGLRALGGFTEGGHHPILQTGSDPGGQSALGPTGGLLAQPGTEKSHQAVPRQSVARTDIRLRRSVAAPDVQNRLTESLYGQ